MKTNSNSRKEQSNSSINNREIAILVVIFVSLVLLLLFSIGEAKAQNSVKGKIGVSISSTVTGSGHGVNYSPQIQYSFNKNSISVGPNIQKRKSNLSGFQLNYERTICARSNDMEYEEEVDFDSLFVSESFEEDFFSTQPYDKRVELFVSFSSIYHQSANLSGSTMAEQKGFNHSDMDLTNLTYRTVESYVGFGLRIKFSDNLKWNNGIAYGGYLSSKGPIMLRSQNDAALMVRSSLSYTFN